MSRENQESQINILFVGVIYFFLFAISCFVHFEKRIFLLPVFGDGFWMRMGQDLFLGVFCGLVLVYVSHLLSKYIKSFQDLASEFEKMLGSLKGETIFFLAAFSALGEEFFFRGLVQGFLGILPASLIFGLLHTGPGKKYRPWTYFALLVGFLLGALYEWRGNLLAPVAAHFVVNFLNLLLLGKKKEAKLQSEESD